MKHQILAVFSFVACKSLMPYPNTEITGLDGNASYLFTEDSRFESRLDTDYSDEDFMVPTTPSSQMLWQYREIGRDNFQINCNLSPTIYHSMPLIKFY
jgi:hypothetical protein